MAGDWMKIELELPDKPEVHSMAGILNIDPDAVVGKLIRVWQWFDKHTTDGNAYGVTFSLPDRISGVIGFGEAMMFVGWLEQKDKTLTMPKFDRHTSKSAKTRALTAKRVSDHKIKSNAEGNGTSVSGALPREEKRRDKENNKRNFPDQFEISDANKTFATNNSLDIEFEFEQFKNHHIANGTKFIDWNAAFRTWLGNSVKFSGKQPQKAPKQEFINK
jgi:hypothetical protein